MRIGLMLPFSLANPVDLDGLVALAAELAATRFHTAWLPNTDGLEALVTLAVVGRAVPGIELGTAVVPTYQRHPVSLAQQAITAQLATGGRLVLGVGPSHRTFVEEAWGLSYDRPVRHTREYLSVLLPLLEGQAVAFAGETVRANTQLRLGAFRPVPVLLAALAPKMLRLAGERTAGTVTWLAGPRTIDQHIVPSLQAAANGRPAPRVVAGFPVCVTSDPTRARRRAARLLRGYGQLPSYRTLLDREGAADPGDVAIVGDEASVREQLRRLAAAGATDLMAVELGTAEERARTRALLSAVA